MGSIIPPDMRSKKKPAPHPPSKSSAPSGIGGRAKENEANSQARAQAFGTIEEESDSPELEKAAPVLEEPPPPCSRCKKEVQKKWHFCSGCGQELDSADPSEVLKVSLDEDDIENYLFRGYILKDVPILRNHSVTLKSSQKEDLDHIDDFLMNGNWRKKKDASGKPNDEIKEVSQFLLTQMQSFAVMASSVVKIDGQSIGKDLLERVEYLNDKGSAFIDLLAKKTVLYNKAITKLLEDEDAVLGS